MGGGGERERERKKVSSNNIYPQTSVTACPKSVSQETFITPAAPPMEEESSSTPVSGGYTSTAGVLSVSAVVTGLVAVLF